MPKDKKPKYVKSEDNKKYQKYKQQKLIHDDSVDNLEKFQKYMRMSPMMAGDRLKEYASSKMTPELKEAYDKQGKDKRRSDTKTGSTGASMMGGSTLESVAVYDAPKREVIVGQKPKKNKMKLNKGNDVTFESDRFQKDDLARKSDYVFRKGGKVCGNKSASKYLYSNDK